MRAALRALVLAAALAGAGPALAAGADLAAAPPGANSCSGCHAARAGANTSVPPIQGRPADEIVAAMAEYRSGKRRGTVMNCIATGFTEAETRAIALWLSQQPAP